MMGNTQSATKCFVDHQMDQFARKISDYFRKRSRIIPLLLFPARLLGIEHASQGDSVALESQFPWLQALSARGLSTCDQCRCLQPEPWCQMLPTDNQGGMRRPDAQSRSSRIFATCSITGNNRIRYDSHAYYDQISIQSNDGRLMQCLAHDGENLRC